MKELLSGPFYAYEIIHEEIRCHIPVENNCLLLSTNLIADHTDSELIKLLRFWENNGDEILDDVRYRHKKLEEKERLKGIVYFAKRIDGLIKIGFTTQKNQRYTSLQEKYGKLIFLHEIESENAFELEQQIHEELKEFNVEYEWFDLPDEIIEEYRSNGKA